MTLLFYYIYQSEATTVSSIVRILFLCPVPNQLQSRVVSPCPCIVTHLQALYTMVVMKVELIHAGKRLLTPSLMAVKPAGSRRITA